MADCFSILRGLCLRATRLDECCTPPAAGTADALVITKGFVQVSYSPEVEAADEYTQKRADGTTCVSEVGCPTYKYHNLELEFCEVDPDLLSLVTGVTIETDHAGESVGFRQAEGAICDANFALEVWTGLADANDECATGGANKYGYMLLPCVTNGIISAGPTIENGTTTFTVTAQTKGGGAWGVGPYDVVGQDAANTPGPLLAPITADEHLLLRTTTIAPPCSTDDSDCGYLPMPA